MLSEGWNKRRKVVNRGPWDDWKLGKSLSRTGEESIGVGN